MVLNGDSYSLIEGYNSGGVISLGSDGTTITLQPGYVYLILYTISGTPGYNSYFQTLPYINGLLGGYYTSTGNTIISPISQNATTTGNFILKVTSTTTIAFRIGTNVRTRVSVMGNITFMTIATV